MQAGTMRIAPGRMVIAMIVAMGGLFATVDANAAESYRAQTRSGKDRYQSQSRQDQNQNRQSSNDGEYARARNADPSGQYKGYPDWAAIALSGTGKTYGK